MTIGWKAATTKRSDNGNPVNYVEILSWRNRSGHHCAQCVGVSFPHTRKLTLKEDPFLLSETQERLIRHLHTAHQLADARWDSKKTYDPVDFFQNSQSCIEFVTSSSPLEQHFRFQRLFWWKSDESGTNNQGTLFFPQQQVKHVGISQSSPSICSDKRLQLLATKCTSWQGSLRTLELAPTWTRVRRLDVSDAVFPSAKKK